MSERTVHHERALVGLAITDPSTIDRVEIELGSYSWTDDVCQRLWPILTDMRRKGDPIADTRAIAILAKEKDVSVADIAKLVTSDAGMVGNDSYHLGFLTEESDRRRLRRVASEILRRVESPKEDPCEIQDWVTKQIYSTTSRTDTRNAGDIMLEVIEQSKNRKTVSTVETGLADVDRCIGGFRSGQLIILAARPSVGKSALAAQIAIHAAKEENNVLFVSLEMSSQETVARALAMECKELDMRSILNGDLASHEIHKAEQIANAYKKIPLRIEDRRGLNIDRLAMLVRSSAAKRKLGLVVIDYLGLIVGDRKKPRWESITEISNSLKTLAQTEQIPILALCQLNRDSEGEVPKLSHLRDSGSIEQDADIVLLLHREKRNAVETELFIAKNRNGPIAKIQLEYEAKRFEFKTAFSDFGNFA
jgi:replicative DNA helicase